MRFQLRAKSSEGKTNLAAIRSIEVAYFAEYHAYVAAAPTPAGVPGPGRVSWPSPARAARTASISSASHREGDVYFQYEVVAAVAGGSTAGNDVFTAAAAAISTPTALADLGLRSTARGPERPAAEHAHRRLARGAVPRDGALGHVTAAAVRLDSVGPCDAASGQSVF